MSYFVTLIINITNRERKEREVFEIAGTLSNIQHDL